MDKKAYQTCLEMFEQRGYEITEMDDDKIVAQNENRETVCAFISNIQKFNVNKVQEYIILLNSLNIKQCIIVYNEVITPAARKVIEDYTDIIMELFHISSLQFNITKHRLNPKFELLSQEEADNFKRQYGNNVAIMLFSDPISRFYGYKRGSIIRVIRTDSIGYRIVR